MITLLWLALLGGTLLLCRRILGRVYRAEHIPPAADEWWRKSL